MFTPHLQTHPLHRPPLQCPSSRSTLPPHLVLRVRQLRTLFITHETVTNTLRTQQATTALTVHQLFSPPQPQPQPSPSPSSSSPSSLFQTTTGWPALAPLWREHQALTPHLAHQASTLAAQIRFSSSSPSPSQPPPIPATIPPLSLPIPQEAIIAREAEIVKNPDQLALLCYLQLRWARLALGRTEAAYFRAHGTKWWRRERERQKEWAKRRDARHSERRDLAWVCLVKRLQRTGFLRRGAEGMEEPYAWGVEWRLRRLRSKGGWVWEGDLEWYRERMLGGRRGRKGGLAGVGGGDVMLWGGSGLRREWTGE